MQLRQIVPLLATIVLATSCDRASETKTVESAGAELPPGHVPITPSGTSTLLPLTQALLDSGNAAFRKQDFAGALAFYSKASQSQPEHAAPWFGTYMVGQATKDSALSDSALRMVRERAPQMQAHPGVTAPGTTPATPYSPHQSSPTTLPVPKGGARS